MVVILVVVILVVATGDLDGGGGRGRGSRLRGGGGRNLGRGDRSCRSGQPQGNQLNRTYGLRSDYGDRNRFMLVHQRY